MKTVRLKRKEIKNPYLPVEAERITTETFLGDELQDISIWSGNQEKRLEDLFTVDTEGNAETAEDVHIILSGDCSKVKRIGEYMTGGKITVEGDIGMHCGNFMSGGVIEIKGNADSWLGREMRGGEIICRGNAALYCGSGYRGEKKGMRGGLIHIYGDAGDFLGETLWGGKIIVDGNAGNMPGAEMQGGEIIIGKDAEIPGANMKDGVCIICGTAFDILPTFMLEEGKKNIDEFKTGFFEFSGDHANRKPKGRIYAKDYRIHE
ncbi:formylmethanofuran dehydrogenase subunit C [Methanoplanus endosymbiosus]|uniref:formylmethanofuran dehydrogenase n=1 Tax=Methanoplanus endosymbiosus TaxID=33865 RepID=A0A9E7PK75_9EURY|nr:formylmethanofuran dehydrogenase subunit C [Methanoplanus endosymbiosus]UUX91568.1 formylmethanofuran dehydrogenase subunit C [Methanoplanus endosymbiosus]